MIKFDLICSKNGNIVEGGHLKVIERAKDGRIFFLDKEVGNDFDVDDLVIFSNKTGVSSLPPIKDMAREFGTVECLRSEAYALLGDYEELDKCSALNFINIERAIKEMVEVNTNLFLNIARGFNII